MAANSQEYIAHHLTNLTYGKLPAGYVRKNTDGTETELTESTWTLAKSGKEAQDMGFMAVHVDSLGWSVFMGLLFVWFFSRVAKKATSGVPGAAQNLVEAVVGFVDNTVKETFHGRSAMIAAGTDYFRMGVPDELPEVDSGRHYSVHRACAGRALLQDRSDC